MAKAKNLWKTKIVIWSDFDPQTVELEDLAREATSGGAICTSSEHTFVKELDKDEDWDGNEFFGEEDDVEDIRTSAAYATLSPEAQISFLVKEHSLSEKEAREIRTATIYGLPLPIAESFVDFDDEKYPNENRP